MFVQGQIVVDFQADITESCISAQSKFEDLSTSSEGEIIKWSWNLGGVSSNLESPGRIFTQQGSYDICLAVEDDKGNVASFCKISYINIYGEPLADFAVINPLGCAPLTVDFEDLSSSPNGDIVKWSWGLGGSNDLIETSDANKNISTEYSIGDLYNVSLSIEDEKGCIHSVTKQDVVEVIDKPSIEISTTEPIGCAFPMEVDFINDGPSEDVTYVWDLGNGEVFEGYDPPSTTYLVEGSYDISVTAVNDVSGCYNEIVLSEYVNTGGTILFDFYPKQICKKGQVQFEDLSPIEADDWMWDFGDGTTSNERDPSHIYNVAGNYTITLSRTTAECSGTQISQYEVEVEESPIIDVEIDKTLSCELPATFQFSATGNPNNRYLWYYGKPGAYEKIIEEQNHSQSFETYGDRGVLLIVDSELGCRAAQWVDTIQVREFKARVSGNTEGCVPFTANMAIQSNLNVPLNHVEWKVVGDDTLTSNSMQLSYLINTAESYGLEVIVENSLGCRDTIIEDELLRGGNLPTVDFSISDTILCPRETITFTDLSSGTINQWNWTFGDSTYNENQNPEVTFNFPGSYDVSLAVGHNGCFAFMEVEDMFEINPPAGSFELVYNCDNPLSVKAISNTSSHDSLVWEYVVDTDTILSPHIDSFEVSFPQSGDYHIALRAFNDEYDCETELIDTVKVREPKALFSMSTDRGCRPLTIQFNDLSEDAVKYKYLTKYNKFNDDTIPNPSIRLTIPGEHSELGLIVEDIHGCTDTTYQTAFVNKVTASFIKPDPVCINDTMTIYSDATSLFSDISTFKWTIGNNIDSSDQQDAVLSFDEIGKHDVKLYVEDDWGCVDSITGGLAAFFRAPNFELLGDSISCTTHGIEFGNRLHANNYSYVWDFGDGDTSHLSHPTHLYAVEGDYPLSVRIEDDEACVNEVFLDQVIQIADPIAQFTADSTFAACPPLITNFTNNSENAFSYEWNFGDDSGQSSEFDPAHLYNKAGVFDVGLIVERTPYCRDTFEMAELIQLDGPKGEFTFEVDSSCVPLGVSFEAILAEEYTLTWDFGDGNLLALDEKVDYSSVEYEYLDAGNFTPKIILEDKENCKISRAGENIQTHDLKADFFAIDSIFCNDIPNTVSFSDNSFSTSPIVDYYWEIGDEQMANFDVSNPEFSIADTGRFDVLLIVQNEFCSDTLVKENYLRIGDTPLLVVPSDTFNCVNTEIELSISSDGETDEYAWYDMNGQLIEGNVDSYKALLNESGFLIVEAKNEYDCLARDSIFVDVIDDKTQFAGPDKTICFGSSTEINIDYGSEVTWLDNSDFMCDTCKVRTLAPEVPTTYTLSLINDYGCQIYDSLFVDVLTQDDIDAGEDQKVCFSEKAILLAYAEGDIEWSPGNHLESTSTHLTAADITESTMFFLNATVDECTLTDSVFVEVIDKAEVVATGDTVCYGDDAQIYASGHVDEVRWEGAGGLSDHTIMNPTSSTLESMQYMVVGRLGNCAPDTAYADIFVYPEIVGHLPKERNYFKGESEVEVNVSMQSHGDYSFTWSPADLVSCQNCETVMVEVQDSAFMLDLAVMEMESGCTDTMSVRIRQFYGCESAKGGIGVPNVFTPNDDGVNDELVIEAPAFGDITSFSVFDRWGQRVFQSSSINDYWDGRLNGDRVQSGVYSYIVSAICPDTGKNVYTSGDITVMR